MIFAGRLSLLSRANAIASIRTFEGIRKASDKGPLRYTPYSKAEHATNSACSTVACMPMPTAIPNAPLAILALTLPFGSRMEGSEFLGYAHFCQSLCFKTTQNITQMMLLRMAESRGMNFEAILDRDHLTLYGEAFKEDIEFLAKTFAETLAATQWPVHEVEAAKMKMTLESLRMESDARQRSMDLIHKEAFGLQSLGRPMQASSWQIADLSSDKLASFKRSMKTPKYILTALGLDLERAQALDTCYLQPAFGRLMGTGFQELNGIKYKQPKDTVSLECGVKEVALSVAFAIPTGEINEAALCVLEQLLFAGTSIPYGVPVGSWRKVASAESIQLCPEMHQYITGEGLLGFTLSSSAPGGESRLLETARNVLASRSSLLDEKRFHAAKAITKIHICEMAGHKSTAIGIGKRLCSSSRASLPSVAEQMQAVDRLGFGEFCSFVKQTIVDKKPYSAIVGPALLGSHI